MFGTGRRAVIHGEQRLPKQPILTSSDGSGDLMVVLRLVVAQ
jgi:hypothetical protein